MSNVSQRKIHVSTLIVRRDKGYADRIRKYRILLDGVEIGRLAEGAELCHEISEGPHVAEARIDWCGSQLLNFEARGGKQILLVRSALRGWRVMLVFYYAIFSRRRYLILELQQLAPADDASEPTSCPPLN
jgi:hypothetical protein